MVLQFQSKLSTVWETSTLDEYIIKYISDYVGGFLWKTTCILQLKCISWAIMRLVAIVVQLSEVVSISLRPHGRGNMPGIMLLKSLNQEQRIIKLDMGVSTGLWPQMKCLEIWTVVVLKRIEVLWLKNQEWGDEEVIDPASKCRGLAQLTWTFQQKPWLRLSFSC